MIYPTVEDAQKAGLGKWASRCRRRCVAPLELFVRVQRNGVKLWNLRCCACKGVLGGAIAYDNIPVQVRTIGPEEVRADPGRGCIRCGEWRNGVELHHWAPMEFFSDANDWPQDYLCRECHHKWHKIMRKQQRLKAEPMTPEEERFYARINFWRCRSSEDRTMFERRATFKELRLRDAEMAEALYDQENLFVEACVKGTVQDVEDHGAALCRGYLAAAKLFGRS